VVAIVNHKEELIGRDRIVNTVLDHIRDGRSAFLVGAAGIGKTAILRAMAGHAQAHGGARELIYCGHTTTLKIALQCLAGQLLARDAACAVPDLQRQRPVPSDEQVAIPRSLGMLTIGKLRQVVMSRLSGHHAVLFDLVQPVRPACAALLEHLVENRGIPIIAAVRPSYPHDIGKLWYVGTTFATIKVPALRPSEARRLIERTLDRQRIRLPDREAFDKKLVSLANGNPRMIVRVCELARSPRYQTGGRTNFRLLLLDLRIDDLQNHIEEEANIPLRGPVATDAIRYPQRRTL
jgi:hypothetical protein